MKQSLDGVAELKAQVAIAQGEDQLERLRQEEQKLQAERNNLQRQLDERVKKLAMDHRLN